MNKVAVFEKELKYIKNESFKNDTMYLIDSLPDYFFEVAAASTGKYHPKYAQGEGGLVRHTKAAVKIAYELLADPAIGNKYTDDEKDLMIISLMLHDGLKLGKERSKYTKFDHPLLVGEFIKENKVNLNFSDDEINFLSDAIASHMGPWTKDYDGNEVLPYPKTKYQNFVHMCDYLASKKFLNVDFDENNNIVEE